MNIHVPFEQFKPEIPRPFRDPLNHGCVGEVRPYGGMFFAVAIIADAPIWLGIYPTRQEACLAVLEAHGGGHE